MQFAAQAHVRKAKGIAPAPPPPELSGARKTLEDAERLRNHVIAALELADVTDDPAERSRLLTYAIVGGGYTGCEAAGELTDLFRNIVPFFRSIALREVRVVLIEAGGTLLAGLPAAMGAYTARNLARRPSIRRTGWSPRR